MENEDFNIPESDADKIARLTADYAALKAQMFAAKTDDAAPAREGTGDADAQGFPKKYVELTVFRGQNPQDLAYAPVGLNGYVIKITRGVKVIVPEVFVGVLNDAVEDVTIQSEGTLITRPSHRFPFTVHREVTEAEYLAFKAKMRAQGKDAAVRG